VHPRKNPGYACVSQCPGAPSFSKFQTVTPSAFLVSVPHSFALLLTCHQNLPSIITYANQLASIYDY